MSSSRIVNSLTNAKYSMLFYILSLVIAFFSRKIFLDTLGANFIGLSTTLQNILGFLNLAEMGIGVSIGIALYEPLYKDDKSKIKDIILILGYLYRIIGLFILMIGIIIAIFLPYIIQDSHFNSGIVLSVYFAFLLSSLLSYFVNYKQILLSSDQKNYLVTCSLQCINIFKTLLQILVAILTSNYYLWIIVEVFSGISLSVVLNYLIKRNYPWLIIEPKNIRILLTQYKHIIKLCKQVFLHRVGSFAEWQIIPILIYAVESSLSVVAMYGNYSLLIDKGLSCINQIYQSTQASIGNLVAEGNLAKIQIVFNEILSLRLFIGGLTAYSFYELSDDFIVCWLGQQYQLTSTIITILAIRLMLTQSSSTSCDFGSAFGLLWDTWAPFVQLGILLFIGIPLGLYLGLEGILLGNLCSYILVYAIWKSILVNHWGLKQSVIKYFFNLVIYWGVIVICGFITHHLTIILLSFLKFDNIWTSFFAKSTSFISFLFIIMGIVFFVCFSHFRSALHKLYYSLHLCH